MTTEQGRAMSHPEQQGPAPRETGVAQRREARSELDRLNAGTEQAIRSVLSGDSLAFLQSTPQQIGQ